ncbi:MAG: hypothetical protein ACW99A_15410 [Candidatus Kariarchaeaceae archaeon]
MLDTDPEKDPEMEAENDSKIDPLSEIDVELLKLKDEYRKMKLFNIEHNDQSRAELATLRFKIRMIEAGIKTND